MSDSAFSDGEVLTEEDASFGVHLCLACGGLGIGADEMTCCDEAMETIDVHEPVQSPELVDVLRYVYGMNDTELRICITLMEEGPMTAAEVADVMDCDSSFANRLLNHLLELGVIEKEEFLLDHGGRVAKFSHSPIPDVERRFKAELGAWMIEAYHLLEEDIVAEKEAALDSARSMAETMGEDGRSSIYYENN